MLVRRRLGTFKTFQTSCAARCPAVNVSDSLAGGD
jgi:hypothetical protein